MERDHLVRQVVDFSKAQTKGFISAYIEVFRQGTREELVGLKGNRVVISADEEALFAKCCMELMDQCDPKGKSYEEKVDFIRRRFPRVKIWF
ncbi:hypothetical protein PSTG_20093, partial [Puccinia striiformis f. sp. tritici PST-78]